ncbi:MAG: hypothetical protein K5770_04970 [Lachnospiraceae bacterium]|nr:hypothetical protein [Lachnospiraceae bacterium]
MDQIRLKQNLSDAGCSIGTIDEITGMCESGNIEGAIHLMRKDRCRLMDELHESGRKVDCLDFLIRSTEKEIEQMKQ